MNIPKNPFKDLILTSEEQAIEDNLEHWKSIPNLEKEKKRYAQMPKNTLKVMKRQKSTSASKKEPLSSDTKIHIATS